MSLAGHDSNMSDTTPSLYDRLGGYDAIAAVANNLLPRLMADDQLGRFWQNRGSDGIDREKQFLIDFLAHSTGGPMYYTGRDMTITHRGMQISESDWSRFIGHLNDTLKHFDLPASETSDVLAFIESTKSEIVEG
jgi:hemoglobin